MSLDSFGLLKTSLLDYPGRVSTVLFTRGCNLRCPWCQNPELVTGPLPENFVSKAAVLEHLRRRVGVVGGVVLTGGEPLWHQDLPLLIDEIRSLGYPVKLDTNGTYPERLAQLKGRVDFVAMDLKRAPSRYDRLGLPDMAERVRESVRVIREFFPQRQFRTTWVPHFNEEDDLPEMARALGPGESLTVTAFRPGKTLDPDFQARSAPSVEALQAVVDRLTALGIAAKTAPPVL